MQTVVMCQPHNNWIDYRSQLAFYNASGDLAEDCQVVLARPRSSLLAYGFNIGLAEAINRNADWFVMLHADVEPASENWARQLIADADEQELDIIHAPVCLKDKSGITSTAVVHDLDPWTRRRRLTLAEVAKLPEVFTVEDVRERLDPESLLMLPNTGCHAVRMGDWCQDWFYTITDKMVMEEGKVKARTIPEDWKMGFDAYELGLKVGGTNRIKTNHYGMACFSTRNVWGSESDTQFSEWKRNQLTSVH